jgi:hypothetical protein
MTRNGSIAHSTLADALPELLSCFTGLGRVLQRLSVSTTVRHHRLAKFNKREAMSETYNPVRGQQVLDEFANLQELIQPCRLGDELRYPEIHEPTPVSPGL